MAKEYNCKICDVTCLMGENVTVVKKRYFEVTTFMQAGDDHVCPRCSRIIFSQQLQRVNEARIKNGLQPWR